MRSPTLPFFRTSSLTLPASLLAVRCFPRSEVPDRLLKLPSDYWVEGREATSRFLQSDSPHRNTIGDFFSAGTLARAVFHQEAKSCFESRLYGSVTGGNSR